MTRRRLLLPLALVLAAACAKAEHSETAAADSAALANASPMPPAADPTVDRAVAVYRGIEAHPAAAESVLTAHGLTRAGIDSLMYEIASDSARAAAYAAAIR